MRVLKTAITASRRLSGCANALLKTRFDVQVEEVRIAEENIAFNIPPLLRDDAA